MRLLKNALDIHFKLIFLRVTILERRGYFNPSLCVSLEWPYPLIKSSTKDGGGENEFHMLQSGQCENKTTLFSTTVYF